MFPTEVLISVSPDGKTYKSVLDEKYETDKNNKPIIKKVVAEFPKQKVRYIHIVGKNRGVLPEWHVRKKSNAWLFSDEIMVK
jgi:hypothetical protein